MERCYFIAGGRALAAIEEYHLRQTPHMEYMKEIAKELGGVPMYGTGAVTAFGIPATGVPAGWKKFEKNMMRPANTKAGEAWRNRMLAAPYMMSKLDVMRKIGVAPGAFFVDGNLFSNDVGWKPYGDTTIILTFKMPDGTSIGGDPYDSERIPDSRYWAIRESVESTK